MTEHLYSIEERIVQLQGLKTALVSLVSYLDTFDDPPEQLKAYRAAMERADELLARSFSGDEITVLGRSIPDLFYRHREWEPPACQMPDGSWQEAEWFAGIEEKLSPVMEAAGRLSSIGYY